uniref:Uncharacterized protein n=1 Tax=Thermoanaerobaculum aquaticum TaxID=1312852 RepID=A0A7C2S8T9_9BACT
MSDQRPLPLARRVAIGLQLGTQIAALRVHLIQALAIVDEGFEQRFGHRLAEHTVDVRQIAAKEGIEEGILI